ncbi:MAG TPA: DUF3237 domain-containing protein [Novosphingobium sp.]|nr:DUF3237 domain-containing protein [Novosphingobium sp.]
MSDVLTLGQPALRLEIEVSAPVSLDGAPMPAGGPVRLVAIGGGRVSGTLAGVPLEGRILPGGADWQTIRTDGMIEIDARYLLECGDGWRAELRCRGLRGGAATGFWSSIELRCPAHPVLDAVQCVGWGRKLPQGVVIDVWPLPAAGPQG